MSRYDDIHETNSIEQILKFNPYHDAKGRFASANGYASFTIRTKDPKNQHMADRAIAREKERAAARDAENAKQAKPAELTQDQKDALEYYVSGDGMYINQMLRGKMDEPMTDMEKQLVNDLDGATSAPVGENKTLYRSVDAEAVFGKISDIQYENLVSSVVYGVKDKLVAKDAETLLKGATGKTITEKGFMSTTTDLEIATEWGGFTGSSKPIVLELTTSKKTTGADLTNHHMEQSEVLLSRGQKYTVDGISAKNGQIYVKCRLD